MQKYLCQNNPAEYFIVMYSAIDVRDGDTRFLVYVETAKIKGRYIMSQEEIDRKWSNAVKYDEPPICPSCHGPKKATDPFCRSAFHA